MGWIRFARLLWRSYIYLGVSVTKQLIILVLSFIVAGCSESSKDTKELVESLIGTAWESLECKEDYQRFAYTKHSFAFKRNELTFNYQYYNNADCEELLGEFIERRPFIVGDELVTSGGMVATKIVIEKIVLQPNGVYDVKDLLYTNNGLLYFGEAVKEEDCKLGNERADVQTPHWSIFYCDQQPIKLDFENYYTKKI